MIFNKKILFMKLKTRQELAQAYGLFVLSMIFFIGGIIMEIITIKEVKHIPVTFVSSICSFILKLFKNDLFDF